MSNSQIRKEEERIDNAIRRRNEIIKNKDLIEKRIDELEDIYTKLKSLEPLNIDLFLLSDPNKFLKKCDGKIAEVEKRRVGLKMIYEAIEERIENLKQFPEIFDTEKGRELEKQFIGVGLEIDKCELEKGKLKEIKDTHEKNKILENHIKVFLHNISKSNVIEWELNDLEYFLKESENKRTEFINTTEEKIKKINEKVSELEEIKTKMETMIKFVLPEKKVKEEKFEDSLKKVNNTISKYNELKNKIINRKTELENEIVREKQERIDRINLTEKEIVRVIEIFNENVFPSEKEKQIKKEIKTEVKEWGCILAEIEKEVGLLNRKLKEIEAINFNNTNRLKIICKVYDEKIKQVKKLKEQIQKMEYKNISKIIDLINSCLNTLEKQKIFVLNKLNEREKIDYKNFEISKNNKICETISKIVGSGSGIIMFIYCMIKYDGGILASGVMGGSTGFIMGIISLIGTHILIETYEKIIEIYKKI